MNTITNELNLILPDSYQKRTVSQKNLKNLPATKAELTQLLASGQTCGVNSKQETKRLLRQRLPEDFISYKPVAGKKAPYIQWCDCLDLLDFLAPDYDYQLEENQIGNELFVKGHLTIHCSDGDLNFQALGSENLDKQIFGGAIGEASAQAMRRVCATVGLGRYLWQEPEYYQELQKLQKQEETKKIYLINQSTALLKETFKKDYEAKGKEILNQFGKEKRKDLTIEELELYCQKIKEYKAPRNSSQLKANPINQTVKQPTQPTQPTQPSPSKKQVEPSTQNKKEKIKPATKPNPTPNAWRQDLDKECNALLKELFDVSVSKYAPVICYLTIGETTLKGLTPNRVNDYKRLISRLRELVLEREDYIKTRSEQGVSFEPDALKAFWVNILQVKLFHELLWKQPFKVSEEEVIEYIPATKGFASFSEVPGALQGHVYNALISSIKGGNKMALNILNARNLRNKDDLARRLSLTFEINKRLESLYGSSWDEKEHSIIETFSCQRASSRDVLTTNELKDYLAYLNDLLSHNSFGYDLKEGHQAPELNMTTTSTTQLEQLKTYYLNQIDYYLVQIYGNDEDLLNIWKSDIADQYKSELKSLDKDQLRKIYEQLQNDLLEKHVHVDNVTGEVDMNIPQIDFDGETIADFSSVIAATDILCKMIWGDNSDAAQKFLIEVYGKKSRHFLSDDELVEYYHLLVEKAKEYKAS
jgi:hypothetical protein